VGGAGKADFFGIVQAEGKTYELTTVKAGPRHMQRAGRQYYEDMRMVTYEAPEDLSLFYRGRR
jgi:hypothetical protein